MGAVSSTNPVERKHHSRPYFQPSVRSKERYNSVDQSTFASQYDPSVDKYDLLIIFPLTEGAFVDAATKLSDNNLSMIEWETVKDMWKQSVPGTENHRNAAVEELQICWERRTGAKPTAKDRIRHYAWKTIAREAIIEKLVSKGLQLKLTSTRKSIYCRIRAPLKLLEVQADKDNYPLQLRGEVDPGAESFWNQTIDNEATGRALEIEEQERMLPLDEARNILERLYRAGKISAADIIINPEEETMETWSLRVHALERIADQVPVYNKFVTYASFKSGKPHLRYLFQTYPSVRGMTLFKTKDRLALTKSIIETCFDLEIMIQNKLVESFMALHDANRGEKLTITSLAQKWTTFWSVAPNELGAPTVTHSAYDEDSEVYFFERPFSQPLADIRDYFGEKVAIYYAWLGHFTYFLLIPAILAALIEVYYGARGSQVQTSGLDWATYAYAFLVMTWAMVYIQCWKRECYAVALKWGTRGFENEEKPRPQFTGEPVRSVVTNEPEIFYPNSRRNITALGSWVLIVLLTIVSFATVFAIYYGEYLLSGIFASTWTFTFVVSLAVATVIQTNSFWFLFVATWLNDLENYKTETDYEDSLVVKMIFFEVFNSFGAAAFVAYAKESIFDTCHIDCIMDLRTLLYAIMIVRILRSTSMMMYTWIEGSLMRVLPKFVRFTAKDNTKDEESIQSLIVDNEDNRHFILEVKRVEVPSTFVDSSAIFFQFAFINMFSIIVPFLSIASLFENLLKIRVDAYKLCFVCRRPHVEQAEDAGFWSETMEYMVYLGIYMNSALVTLAFPDSDNYSYSSRSIVFLAISQVLVLYAMFIQYLIPSEPKYVREVAKRHAFIADKYVNGFEDKNSSAEDLGIFTDQKGHVDDKIDVDALQLFDLRKSKAIDESKFEEIERLEAKKRELTQELKILRDRLQEVYKTEIFNDATGVGETRHGLPLGRLTVRLVKIKDFDTGIIRRVDFPFKIRVEIRGTRVGATAPIPKLPASLTDSSIFVMPEDGCVDLNQSLGPFAPIKTIDAEIFFHILFHDKDRPSDAPQATLSLRLKDLDDQRQHDKILKWKIRDAKANLQPSDGTLYVNLVFQYSKVVPIRADIYRVQDQVKIVDGALMKLRSGKD